MLKKSLLIIMSSLICVSSIIAYNNNISAVQEATQDDLCARDLIEKIKAENPPATGILRDVQELDYALLKKFAEVCKKHNLKYWLDFGTLIGAVRHDGFIPWDDDIDVCMPIEDYNKFIEIFNQELAPEFQLVNIKPNFIKMTYTFCAPKTENDKVKFYDCENDDKMQFFIDIFPYYPVSDVKLVENSRKSFASFFEKNKNKENPAEQFKKSAVLAENLNKEIYSPEGNIYSLGMEWRFSSIEPYVHYESELFPLVEHTFEDDKFFIPNNYDSILKRAYGDYMKVPNNKRPHHIGKWAQEKSSIQKIKELKRKYCK